MVAEVFCKFNTISGLFTVTYCITYDFMHSVHDKVWLYSVHCAWNHNLFVDSVHDKVWLYSVHCAWNHNLFVHSVHDKVWLYSVHYTGEVGHRRTRL